MKEVSSQYRIIEVDSEYVFRTLLLLFITALAITNASAQSVAENVWLGVRDILLPSAIVNSYKMREFIVSEPILENKRTAHLERVNRIWDYAVYLTDGDIEEALFIAATSTLPYHSFPAYIPVVNWVIRVPVSTESKEEFRQRLLRLPSLLYSGKEAVNDRDKLPHFFGSALIQFRCRSELVTRSSGEAIEIGEKFFKLEGAYDERDIEANICGGAFGEALARSINCKPSEYFVDRHLE